jgi:hypothetical protein
MRADILISLFFLVEPIAVTRADSLLQTATNSGRGQDVEGLAPAAAPRAAQLAVRKDRRWAAPYYQAAFTPQGEWK